MVMFLWIGGLIMALGCVVALVPPRKRDVLARATIDGPDEIADDAEPVSRPVSGAHA